MTHSGDIVTACRVLEQDKLPLPEGGDAPTLLTDEQELSAGRTSTKPKPRPKLNHATATN